MRNRDTMRTRTGGRATLLGVGCAALLLLAGAEAPAQVTGDFCGCAGSPDSLGAFNTADPSTWPEGTVNIGTSTCFPNFRIPVPESGVLVFDSFTVQNVSIGCGPANSTVTFLRNAANTPVTLLVQGDLRVNGGNVLSVGGFAGSNGSAGSNGVGGQGGPGGFAGGDGAYQLSNLAADGGAGLGPGGGLGSFSAGRVPSLGGTFFGVPELRPLLGGSGGGGGHSASNASGCSAGGGGGGGGALLIAANGTVGINGAIRADGGAGGVRANSGCDSSGSGGSGGAIRILASRIEGGGAISANGGSPGACNPCALDGGSSGSPGRIRLEAITNVFSVTGTSPVAIRAPAPGPLVNPITPTVAITGIDGAATPLTPVGHRGQIDMLVSSPGPVQIDLASTDVPVGTALEVTVRPKVGGVPFSERVTLSPAGCSGGACAAALVVDFDPGSYIVEARATFETP